MYGILIYLVLVLPNAIKKYWYRQDVKQITKLLNIIIPLFFFTFYIEVFRTKTLEIYRIGIVALSEANGFIVITKELDVLTSILHLLVCFYVSITFLNIASNLKSLKLLILSLPVIWLSTTISFYKFFIVTYGFGNTSPYLIFTTGGIITSFPFLLLWFIYTRKSFKKLFSSIEKIS